jgi:hypothetical protein
VSHWGLLSCPPTPAALLHPKHFPGAAQLVPVSKKRTNNLQTLQHMSCCSVGHGHNP